ncbi:hypothetical protein GQ42DRAFT_67464 [Ramicandelaber brevisporus]|nr:hypothetical protein GQ42DRAFT_67464 [Ramicandelaber brevisporus]
MSFALRDANNDANLGDTDADNLSAPSSVSPMSPTQSAQQQQPLQQQQQQQQPFVIRPSLPFLLMYNLEADDNTSAGGAAAERPGGNASSTEDESVSGTEAPSNTSRSSTRAQPLSDSSSEGERSATAASTAPQRPSVSRQRSGYELAFPLQMLLPPPPSLFGGQPYTVVVITRGGFPSHMTPSAVSITASFEVPQPSRTVGTAESAAERETIIEVEGEQEPTAEQAEARSQYVDSFVQLLGALMGFGNGGNGQSMQGQPPASEPAIYNLPTVNCANVDASSQCAVCQEQLRSSSELDASAATTNHNGQQRSSNENIREMPCQHRFHEACLFTWLRISNTCPTCRYEIDTDNPEYNAAVHRRMQERLANEQQQNQSAYQLSGTSDTSDGADGSGNGVDEGGGGA